MISPVTTYHQVWGEPKMEDFPKKVEAGADTEAGEVRVTAGRYYCENLILRDYLAVDRTKLANERTFLAYMRTFISVLASGVGLVTLLTGLEYKITGYILIALSPIILVYGTYRFFVVHNRIRHVK